MSTPSTPKKSGPTKTPSSTEEQMAKAPGAAGPTGSVRAPSSTRALASQAAIDAGLDEVAFLTVAEVAAVMRVSKMTVYRLVHSAELPAVRVGRSFRVPDQAVHDYLQAAFVEAG
jgi:excisionase family DNA binding protein